MEFFKYMYAYVDLIKVDEDSKDIKDPRMKNFHQRIDFIEKMASEFSQATELKNFLKQQEDKQQFYKGLKLATQRTLPLVLGLLAYSDFKESGDSCPSVDYVAPINETLKTVINQAEYSYMPDSFGDVYENLVSMVPPLYRTAFQPGNFQNLGWYPWQPENQQF